MYYINIDRNTFRKKERKKERKNHIKNLWCVEEKWEEKKTSSPKGNDRSPESNVPWSNLISKNI